MVFRHSYCCFSPVFFNPPSETFCFPLLPSDHSHQLFSSLLLPHCPHQRQWSCFTFLVSAVTPGYIFTLEDLVLGTSGDREHATFWVWVTSFNMVFPSSTHLPSQTLEKNVSKCYILTSRTTVLYQGLAQW